MSNPVKTFKGFLSENGYQELRSTFDENQEMTWYQKADNVREIFSLYIVKELSYVAITAYQPEKHIVEAFFEKNLHTDF